jgi:hypothetical protein
VGLAWSFLFWALTWIGISLTPFSPRLGRLMLGTDFYQVWKDQMDAFKYRKNYKIVVIIMNSFHIAFAVYLFLFANIRLIDHLQ